MTRSRAATPSCCPSCSSRWRWAALGGRHGADRALPELYDPDGARIGEASGKLEEVLEGLCAYYQRNECRLPEHPQRHHLSLVMIAMMLGVIGVIVVQILPVFQQVLQSGMDVDQSLGDDRRADGSVLGQQLTAPPDRRGGRGARAWPRPVVDTGLFPGLYGRMIAIGFKTGTPDTVMERIAQAYEELVDRRISGLIAALEPTLVAVLCLVIGLILLSVMLMDGSCGNRIKEHDGDAASGRVPKGRGGGGCLRPWLGWAWWVALVFFWGALPARGLDAARLEMAEQAVRRRSPSVMPWRGRYPPDLQYLADRYGLLLDTDRYVYHCRLNGANLMPEILVFHARREPCATDGSTSRTSSLSWLCSGPLR